MNYIIFILLTFILLTSISLTSCHPTYNIKKWKETQCPNKGIKSFGKLPIGDYRVKKALLNNHSFFFKITFNSDNTSQLCYFCDENINPTHYKGICKL